MIKFTAAIPHMQSSSYKYGSLINGTGTDGPQRNAGSA